VKRRTVAVVLVVGVLAVAVAGAAVLSQRQRTGGPLAGGDEAMIVVDAFEAGSLVTYGLQNLTNSGHDEITVRDVKVLVGSPPVVLIDDDVMAYGPSRLVGSDSNLFDVRAGWPPGGDAVPAIGATIAPNDRIGLELLIGVRVPSVDEGIGTLEGVTVRYTAGGREFVRTFHLTMTICPRGHVAKCDSFLAAPR